MIERIAKRIAELDAAEKETEQQLIRIRVVLSELRSLLENDVPDDRDDLIVRLREERDRLMSRLGVAHETIDMAEENGASAETLPKEVEA